MLDRHGLLALGELNGPSVFGTSADFKTAVAGKKAAKKK
jgi:hypothetical protein